MIQLLNCLFSGQLIQKARSTNWCFLIPYHYPLKWGLLWLPAFVSTLRKVNFKHGTRDGKQDEVMSCHIPQFFWIKDKNNWLNQNNIRIKLHNENIIIIVTWSGGQYHISWMRSHFVFWVISWYDLIHSMWYSTPEQFIFLIICIYNIFAALIQSLHMQ